MTMKPRRGATAILIGLLIAVAAPAHAQPSTAGQDAQDDVPSVGQLFTGTLRGFTQLPSAGNLQLLTAGAIAAAASHAADAETSRTLSVSGTLHESFKAGGIIGSTPFALGASFAAYAIGRAARHPRLANTGADLVQAQLMAEALTIGIKQATRRARPSGSGYSFPSGHTTVSFASATVLQQHFGWRIGIPAYLVATYVGAARIQDKRHYLSDVVFGAALGTVAGRTVTLNRHHRVALGAAPTIGGGAVMIFVR